MTVRKQFAPAASGLRDDVAAGFTLTTYSENVTQYESEIDSIGAPAVDLPTTSRTRAARQPGA